MLNALSMESTRAAVWSNLEFQLVGSFHEAGTATQLRTVTHRWHSEDYHSRMLIVERAISDDSVCVMQNVNAVRSFDAAQSRAGIYFGRAERFLAELDSTTRFDLIVTSPPYNIGKPYEERTTHERYLRDMRSVLRLLASRLTESGSLCWQVGSVVEEGSYWPLDVDFIPIIRDDCGMTIRNRIVWQFGHGLHSTRRFSGRYETIIWATKSDSYHFDLDAVRVPQKYPGKRAYKGPNKGTLSSNPLGKNPEDTWGGEQDLWSIPNVKGNHVEKTVHPCQFPVGLIERLVKALVPENGLVYDPFAGVGSAGVATLANGRRFVGSELEPEYCRIAIDRLRNTIAGVERYRPHDRPVYDHTKSPLSRVDKER